MQNFKPSTFEKKKNNAYDVIWKVPFFTGPIQVVPELFQDDYTPLDFYLAAWYLSCKFLNIIIYRGAEVHALDKIIQWLHTIRIQTTIESVGKLPTGRPAKVPGKGTDEILETKLNGEMFCYKRKKLS